MKIAKLVLACAALSPFGAIADEAPINPVSDEGAAHSCARFYPISLMQQGIEGTTTLAFDITREGGVARVRVVEPSGYRLLDTAAVNCAVYWRYQPAMRDGKPVRMPWRAKVAFKLPTSQSASP